MIAYGIYLNEFLTGTKVEDKPPVNDAKHFLVRVPTTWRCENVRGSVPSDRETTWPGSEIDWFYAFSSTEGDNAQPRLLSPTINIQSSRVAIALYFYVQTQINVVYHNSNQTVLGDKELGITLQERHPRTNLDQNNLFQGPNTGLFCKSAEFHRGLVGKMDYNLSRYTFSKTTWPDGK